MKKFLLLAFGALVALSDHAYAYTSIAVIQDHSLETFYRSSNYKTQKEADGIALEGCREAAGKNGLAKLAKQCKVVTRGKGPGYGALSCGTDGCGWTTGYESAQAAVDSAYQTCAQKYGNCQDKNIDYWEDFAGFSKAPASSKQTVAGDCRPRTEQLQCSSNCTNGSCVVKYTNGCQMRVEVQATYDPFKNQWVYPAPSC